MRVVVIGATGNVGTALLDALAITPEVTSVLGVARRIPAVGTASRGSKTSWHAADISRDPLDFLTDADAVVHLAWLIQPSRDPQVMRATNVEGTARVVRAVIDHRVPSLVYASSVGTYAPAPKSPPRTESWPATGIPTSTYSRQKAEVEALLDEIELQEAGLRIVRMRTSLVFQRAAASEVHRLFLGPLLPWHLPRALRLVPGVAPLQFQATHATDIADAYLRALTRDVAGAFNVAAEPVLTPERIADAVGGRVLPFPRVALRALVRASYASRLQPAEPGWLDMATQTPILDCTRAATLLGWRHTISSVAALTELLDGIGDGAGFPTPALEPR
jgi:UDP-glucose 4-epimerase